MRCCHARDEAPGEGPDSRLIGCPNEKPHARGENATIQDCDTRNPSCAAEDVFDVCTGCVVDASAPAGSVKHKKPHHARMLYPAVSEVV